MKKIFYSLFFIFVLLINSVSAEIYVEDDTFKKPEITSASAVLCDLNSGRVIYSKDPNERLYPASTTKIMTAILALELGDMSETVTATVAALAPITNEDSHMGILVGEELTMEQLVNGMMVYSANDAANVIATHIAGTSEHFVELMNKKAQEIGTTDTNFTNAYGIHDDNHYTTANDLMLIAKYAMGNEKFEEIVKQKLYTIPPTNKYTTERNLPSTNLFLGTSRSAKFYNKNVIGVKTGHTSDSGYCLVSAAAKDGTEFLCVLLKSKDQDTSYTESKSLLDYGFNNYNYITIAKAGDVISDSKVYEAVDDTRVAITVSEDLNALLPKDINQDEAIETIFDVPDDIKAPIKKGDVVGSVTYNYKDAIIGHADLIASNDVERNNFLFVYHIIKNIITSPFFIIPLILLLILLVFARINKLRQDKKKRLRRLHNREKGKQTEQRQATRRPLSDRYEDRSNNRSDNSRYKK